MTHIKCKYDMPFCLMAHPVQYAGEYCGRLCGCPYQQGKDVCRFLRFQHGEFEKDTNKYCFCDNPNPDPGLFIDDHLIAIDLITYLEIDGKILIDFT